jgi:methyl-accepting chemotaxis protein
MLQDISIKHKLGIGITAIAFIAMIIGYLLLQYESSILKDSVYKEFSSTLQDDAKFKFNAKKSVGISNAVSIANNYLIHEALRTNNRDTAIGYLNSVYKNMKEFTKFQNIKIHIHTKDNKSFIRSWKPNKFGDDLSGFRHSIVKVNSTKRPVNTFEIGKAGLSIRSVLPIIDKNGEHLGSLEFMQGLNSIAKTFAKRKDSILVFMDTKVTNLAITKNNLYKNRYLLSQKFKNNQVLDDIDKINLNSLFKNKFFITEKFLHTYIDIKDFNNKKLGFAIVSSPISKVNIAVDSANKLINISLIIIIALIIFILIALAYASQKLVIKPLSNLNEAILNLTKSNDSSTRLTKESNDELGQAVDNFNLYLKSIEDGIKQDMVVIEDVTKVVQEVTSGSLSIRISEKSNNNQINQLVDVLNDMMEGLQHIITHSLIILKDYQNENFKTKTTIKCSGEICELMNGINDLGIIISKMLVENKQNGLNLIHTSDELLENFELLSKASKESASSIEQTLSFLENMTSNMIKNTNDVSRMAKYANSLNISSTEGQNFANETTKAMEEINDEVTSINEAITVIDQIAFQTNILSLNAAVEAATAGEAGKGFAVVAQEVRNLASRSAEAANSIKQLVQNATAKANGGKDIANNMIVGYSQLKDNISKTLEVIDSVEHYSKEQEKNIAHINDLMSILDKKTQQNTTITEQTQNIAIETKGMAQDIVNDTNKKDFEGK